MQAIEISHPGGPEVLIPVERPLPSCGPGEVLIQVEAAGVNRPDLLQRQGRYAPPPGASDLPGLEVAGRIVGGQLEGTGWKLGDAVCALVAGGAYAEYCVAPAGQCLPVPAGLTFIEAAALPETYFTVWSNVFDRGRLQAGETLLVQGGASGIGVAAIQIASALGARVIATAGSAEKCATCLELGAERAINYRCEDFGLAAREFTQGRGVDVILDMVAGEYVARELECLAEDGRLVLIAVQGGIEAKINARLILSRRLTVTGSTLRPRSVEFKSAIASRLKQAVWPLVEAGRIRPVIHSVFPLAHAAQAHAALEAGAHVGKIMLAVGPDAGAPAR